MESQAPQLSTCLLVTTPSCRISTTHLVPK